MAKFYSKIKGRQKLAYRTPNWFRREQKFKTNKTQQKRSHKRKGQS